MEPSNVVRQFFKSIVKDIFIGFIASCVVAYLFDRAVGHKTDTGWWLFTSLTLVLGAYITRVTSEFLLVTHKAIFREFNDLCDKHRNLIGEVYAMMSQRISDISNKLNVLANSGESAWKPAQRIECIKNILDEKKDVEIYFATMTDAPYDSCSATEDFDKTQRKKLRYADARRLLVYPIKDLLSGLRVVENRYKTERFLSLHRQTARNGTQAALVNYGTIAEFIRRVTGKNLSIGFQLRYLPSDTLSVLREVFRTDTGDLDPPVDMAVIADSGDSLVFGQAVEGDAVGAFPAGGKAYIYSGNEKAQKYGKAFDNLWRNHLEELYPLAQIQAWVELLEMRDSQSDTDSWPVPAQDTSGSKFFRSVINLIEDSSELRAIDVADSTKHWFQKSEYIDFHKASCESAKNHKGQKDSYHGRVFVLKRPMETGIANTFLRQTLIPEHQAGIEVHIVYARMLVERNLPAVDCIFGTQWGFYLTPLDSFEEHLLSAGMNLMNDSSFSGYIRVMFDDLVKHSGSRRVVSSDLSDSRSLCRFLTSN